MINHRSLAFRLAAWYALLLSATFALVGMGMFYGLLQYLRSTLADSLHRRSVQVEQILAQRPADARAQDVAGDIETRVAPEFNNRFVRVTRAPAETVYRSGDPADRSFEAAAVPATQRWPLQSRAFTVTTPAHDSLMMSATVVTTPSGRYLVELGASLRPAETLETHLLGVLGLLLPVLVLCAAGGGYLLVGRALRPVDEMARSAEMMAVQDLKARLPVVPSGDAIERLSISLNHMLARLQESMQTSRRFLADASHELRTPLTVIKGELQEIVGAAHVGTEVRDRLGSVLEEVARLEHLVTGLLVLSRLDAGEAHSEWVDVDLADLCVSTVDQMRLMAEDAGIRLQIGPLDAMTVRGDRARLKQVIVNLIDNAIRFTPRGGSVTLSANGSEQQCILEIRDTGIGIPVESQPHIFDRFYRVEASRSREDGGAGLGLSIVRSILTAHHATIELESAPGLGSCFRLRFPRA